MDDLQTQTQSGRGSNRRRGQGACSVPCGGATDELRLRVIVYE